MASMGAGLSLILAGSLALSLVSALIAFNGWPGTQSRRTADERAVIAELAPARAAQRTPADLRLPDMPRRRATPRPARTSARLSGGRPSRRPGTAAPVRAVATKTKAAAQVSHAPEHADSAPVKAATVTKTRKPDVLQSTLAPAVSTVKNLGSTLDSTVSRTGKAVGDLVRPVLPAVGATVTQTTAAVGKLLSDLTNALSKAVANVGVPTPAPAPAPAPAAPDTTATVPSVPAADTTPAAAPTPVVP